MAGRPDVAEGEIVMLCWHLYQAACAGQDIAWPAVRCTGPFRPRREFKREDGTAGACDYVVLCGVCSQLAAGDPILVEEVFVHGQFHVADHIRNIPTVEAQKAGR